MNRLIQHLRRLQPDNPLLPLMGSDDLVPASVAADVEVRDIGNAVEVRGHLTGPGVTEAAWLELSFDADDLIISTARGGSFESAYPPDAFASRPRSIGPGLPVPPMAGGAYEFRFGSERGRSSDAELPFFTIGDASGSGGLWFAIGFGGQWQARLSRLTDQRATQLRITGPGSSVDLEEGEVLRLPRVIVGTYEGGDGWSAIRRFLHHHSPTKVLPWVVYDSWFNEDGRINAARLQSHLNVASDIGVEVFEVDAAWYSDAGEQFSGPGMGTWTEDREKFPDGLSSLSAQVHDAGLKFGLWFEPERAHPESWVARSHPEWTRTAPGQMHLLVDFGVPEAAAWALELMSSSVEHLAVDWIKWDFNIADVAPFWAGDERAELAHQFGVLRVAEQLRQQHPRLVLEMCASGGNRMDVEQLLVADTYWISDQTSSPDVVRHHLGSACHFLPAQYRYTSVAPQRVWSNDGAAIESTRLDRYPDAWFLSSMAGVFGLMDRLSAWSDENRERARFWINEFKSYRHLLDGEFRRFVDEPTFPLDGWECWEFSDPERGEAVLIAFRQRSEESTREFSGNHSWTVHIPEVGGATVLRLPADG